MSLESEALDQFKAKLKDFVAAAHQLGGAWAQTIRDAPKIVEFLNEKYPFDKDFFELITHMIWWKEHVNQLSTEGVLEWRPSEPPKGDRFDKKTEQDIRDLLSGAFEGGSNYWYRIEKKKLPPGTTMEDFKEGGSMQPRDTYYHWSQLIPTYEGGALIIRDISEGEGEKYTLDLPALKKGWELLGKKYPKIQKEVLEGNYDASDADVFLQLAVFGDVIYG